MAVPTSGTLRLASIRNELQNNSYTSTFTGSPTSLKSASLGLHATINVANINANKPDTSTPYAMSEFYGYDHDGSIGTSPGSFSQATSAAQNNNRTITISTADNSPWSVTSKPTWVSVSAQSGTGSSSITLSMTANTGGNRAGNIVITFTFGTLLGSHPSGTNNLTTRTTSVSQAGSGGDDNDDNEGLGDGEDP